MSENISNRKQREEIRPKLERATELNQSLKNEINQMDAEFNDYKRRLVDKFREEPYAINSLDNEQRDYLQELLSKFLFLS